MQAKNIRKRKGKKESILARGASHDAVGQDNDRQNNDLLGEDGDSERDIVKVASPRRSKSPRLMADVLKLEKLKELERMKNWGLFKVVLEVWGSFGLPHYIPFVVRKGVFWLALIVMIMYFL